MLHFMHTYTFVGHGSLKCRRYYDSLRESVTFEVQANGGYLVAEPDGLRWVHAARILLVVHSTVDIYLEGSL